MEMKSPVVMKSAEADEIFAKMKSEDEPRVE